eukprot:5565586-Karenia_brevis.AAC.1
MNINGASARDRRQIEVIANCLLLWNGAQLAIDATFVSPFCRNGEPHPGADEEDDIELRRARAKKERTYRELLRSQ